MYRLSDPAFIDEFAKIPRFFPNSDFSRFLTNGNQLLGRLLSHYERQEAESVRELVTKMVESYLKTFSDGTLIEKLYTFNYR